MTILAAIGDITRFETPKALASYSGLTPGLEQSGVKLRGKGITKEGRRELRWVMVEVAWRAVKADPHWKKYFEELKRRMHPNQAIVATPAPTAGYMILSNTRTNENEVIV